MKMLESRIAMSSKRKIAMVDLLYSGNKRENDYVKKWGNT